MKHLLNGVAIAAALAIAVPAWAQMSPSTPPKPAAAPAAAAAPMAAAPKQMKQMKRKPMRMARHHHWRGGKMRRGSGDAATDQLNREELARIQGAGAMGGPPMMAPPPPMQGGPRPSSAH